MTVPTGLAFEMKAAEMQHESMPVAHPGGNEGPILKNVAMKDLMRGYVASDSKNDTAKVVPFFTVLDCRTSHIAENYAEILTKVGRWSFEKEPKFSGYVYFMLVQVISEELLGYGDTRFLKVISKELWEYGHTRFVAQVIPSEKERKVLEYGDIRFVEMIPGEKERMVSEHGNIMFVKMIPSKLMTVRTFAEHPPVGRFSVVVGVIKAVKKKEPLSDEDDGQEEVDSAAGVGTDALLCVCLAAARVALG